MQRRVEQADGDGQPVHRFEDLDEIGPLRDAQLLECGFLGLGGVGEDHAAHDRQPVVAEEHVLGPAQADALGTELAGVGRVGTVVGVGPHRELPLADAVGPAEDHVELLRRLARRQRDLAEHDLAGGAVDRQDITLADGDPGDGEALTRDADLLRPDDRRLPPAAGHHRRMADEPAARGEDAFGHRHAVHVLG